MAHIFADNVREGSVTEGTGNFVTEGGIPAPGGVIIGRTLAEVLQVSDTFDYTIFHTTLNEWEIGTGTYTDVNTFSRSPSSSSNGGNLVNFSPGMKHVFIAPVAARMSDVISDGNLPAVQTGKTFTSTVTITGQTGLRVVYDDQSWSFGGVSADASDYASTFSHGNNASTLYVDTDKLSNGFRIRFHEGGANAYDVLNVKPDGTAQVSGGTIKTLAQNNSPNATVFPIGHTILVHAGTASSIVIRQLSAGVSLHPTSDSMYVLTDGAGTSTPLAGGWRQRGRTEGSGTDVVYMMERVQ